MVHRLLDLSGIQAWLAWIRLTNIILGVMVVLGTAWCKNPPKLATYLTFVCAAVVVFSRAFYRNLYGKPINGWDIVSGLTIASVLVWMAVDVALCHYRKRGIV